MQLFLRPFDGIDPTYTTEGFLNAITANVVMTTRPNKQTDSPYHETWILKRIAMVHTALIEPAQQWYSHLPLDIKKWQAFCREFPKVFDNQQSQTQAKLLLTSITRASGEQIETLALRIAQMTQNSYVSQNSKISQNNTKKDCKSQTKCTGTTTSICTNSRKNTSRIYHKNTNR